MRINRSTFASGLLTALLLSASVARGGSLNGGDAATATSADVFLDIVFAIDTSGSMDDEASSISTNVGNAITNLACPTIDVWARARFLGIQGTFGGTLFDESATTVLSSAGDSVTINNSEDCGPVVTDFSTATNFWQGPAQAGQTYVKAVVTIGDEGLENGEPVLQDDYNAGKAANDAAIANSVVVFSIIGNFPSSGVPELFTALAEGGATLGGHVFNDTGGFAIESTDPELQAQLEAVFCSAAITGLGQLSLLPLKSTNPLTATHTVTARVRDDMGAPAVGTVVSFSVEAGPNAGASGTCSANSDCTTDSSGEVSFSYAGTGGSGEDTIIATATVDSDPLTSNQATKLWVSFNPGGRIVRGQNRMVRFTVTRPGPDQVGVRCIGVLDPNDPDFTGVSFTSFPNGEVDVDLDLTEDDTSICCEYENAGGGVSAPICSALATTDTAGAPAMSTFAGFATALGLLAVGMRRARATQRRGRLAHG